MIFIDTSKLVHPYSDKLNVVQFLDCFWKIHKGNQNFTCKKYANKILLPVPGPENGYTGGGSF